MFQLGGMPKGTSKGKLLPKLLNLSNKPKGLDDSLGGSPRKNNKGELLPRPGGSCGEPSRP